MLAIMVNKMVGRYFTSLSPPFADGVADTFGGRTSALPLILRRCEVKQNSDTLYYIEHFFKFFFDMVVKNEDGQNKKKWRAATRHANTHVCREIEILHVHCCVSPTE